MQSRAATVAEYISRLPPDRREVIEAVRKHLLAHLDSELEEGMQYGMIGYYVPHSVYPAGYHCDPRQPLPYCSLANQKGHLSLYLMCLYSTSEQEAFKKRWEATGRKIDMGKCCIRFKTEKDLALDVLGDLLERVTARNHIKHYEAAVGIGAPGKAKRAKKTPRARARGPKAGTRRTTKPVRKPG